MSTGNPELWSGAIEVLVPNATNLMGAIAELLKATEIAAVTKSEFIIIIHVSHLLVC